MTDYTLQQAQTDVASLRGQFAHLLATAEIINLTVDGTAIFANAITTVHPGSSPAVAETWQSLGTFPSGTTTHGRYRMTVEGEVELDINLTGTPTSGTFPNALPAAYRPAVVKRFVIAQGGTLGLCAVSNATGNVSMTIGAGGSATADVAVRFALD